MSRLLKVSDLTIDAIRQENKEQGSYFFDQETMKHYGSSFKCNYVYEEIIEERSHYFFFTTDKVISEKLRGMLGGYHFDVYPHLLFDKLCTIRVLTYDSKGNQSREHATATTNKITLVDIIDKFVGVLTTLGFDNIDIKNGIAEYAYCNCSLDVLEEAMEIDSELRKKDNDKDTE